MTKFHGQIGFGYETEVSPGVYDMTIVERPYSGEVVRETLERVAGQTVLGESKTGNSFSIVADAYANTNYFDMEYVKWQGRYWSVKQIEVRQRPRLLVRIGGVYNGPIYKAPDTTTP